MIKGIQEGVALWLGCICSSFNDYSAKSIEYTKYLLNKGHYLILEEPCFNNVGKISWHEILKKKSRNAKERNSVFAII